MKLGLCEIKNNLSSLFSQEFEHVNSNGEIVVHLWDLLPLFQSLLVLLLLLAFVKNLSRLIPALKI